MNKFNQNEFANALLGKCTKNEIRQCPFCGGNDFTTTENFATIMIGDDLSNISIGPNIPSGMIICKNCGHIDFFALGALGLLHKTEDENAEK